MADWLWQEFGSLVVLDTETTGLSPGRDRIIELAALKRTRAGEAEEFDLLISLPEGQRIPEFVAGLTGITDERLRSEGVEPREAAGRLAGMLSEPGTLLAAYNAQFDLCFIYYLLRECALEHVLRGLKFLDALTAYRDRRPYPHKLESAVAAYGLRGVNSHRAIDDAEVTLELLEAMAAERDDLMNYVNLFGYNPKFGAPRPKIGSVTYRPDPYGQGKALYEL